jgi:hypothetical protein
MTIELKIAQICVVTAASLYFPILRVIECLASIYINRVSAVVLRAVFDYFGPVCHRFRDTIIHSGIASHNTWIFTSIFSDTHIAFPSRNNSK